MWIRRIGLTGFRIMKVIKNAVQTDKMCLISYNSRGFSQHKQEFCNFLLSPYVNGNKLPILCNQENFMLKANCYKIKKAFPGHFVIVKPAVKTSHDKGRPKGGLFVAVPDIIKNEVRDVSPTFWRIQAIIITIKSSRILLINSYFPTDQRTVVFDESELLETLQSIRNVIDANNHDQIYWLGDINADFVRKSGHVKCVDNFVNECNFVRAWDNFQIDFTHYQETGNVTHISTVDHIFWNDACNDKIVDAGVVHVPENASDHCPVYCVVDIGQIPPEDHQNTKPSPPKPCWKKASQDQKNQFSVSLETELSNIILPDSLLHCRDVHCDDPSHSADADSIIIEVLQRVEKSAYENLPVPVPPKVKSNKSNKPGWSTEVHPYRENAHFWHKIWMSAGRPINTQLHQIMKRTKNVFHYQVRKLKKSQEIISKNKLLDACLNGSGDLFSEIKKLRNAKPCVANSMDGVRLGIADHFQNIYKNLYNSVDDHEDLMNLCNSVEGKVNSYHLNDVDKVTPDVVKEAAQNLKDSKSDPTYNFSSDCIKHGPDALFNLLSIIIKSFLVHGKVTLFLLLATLVPLIKDKLGSINESKNYRSIALSSLLLKILDWIILLLFGRTLGVDELQFAYQPGSSTSMCTWAAVETINYFMRNGNDVYTCLMDMTKAFDMVKHSLLFKKLITAGLSVIFVRLLLFIYMNQFANVRWNGSFSSVFSVKNGVRQGAILSGILYCFYTNDLFTTLRKNKTGCWVNNTFMGIFGYSDDNLLVAPSLDALQEMLQTCEQYANTHNLKFSTNENPIKCKTKCIAFLKREREIGDVQLCGVPLPWVSGGVHLGNHISNQHNGMKHDITIKRANFISKNIDLNQEFYFCHPSTKVKMNTIYNLHFTGSSLWDLFAKEAIMVEKSWNTSVRIMFDLPLQTHKYLIEPISETRHLKFVLIDRFLGFLQQIEKSQKHIPKQLLSFIKHDVRSTTGSNLRNILLLTDKPSVEDVTRDDLRKLEYAPIDKEDKWKVKFIKEITDIKFNKLIVEDFTTEELEDILEYLCTS